MITNYQHILGERLARKSKSAKKEERVLRFAVAVSSPGDWEKCTNDSNIAMTSYPPIAEESTFKPTIASSLIPHLVFDNERLSIDTTLSISSAECPGKVW